MAELPRYQSTGYLPADVPRLDFANLKESVAMTQGINSALDRLAGFAFKEAAEKAQREGMQYGAENMPSAEQVMRAMEEGKSPAELFAKPGTVFGDAARKVQAGQLRSELEVLGRQELAKLSATVDTGTFNLQEVQTTIKSLTAGYARAISAVDAEEGLKFRSSMATAGNSVYVKATENFAKIVAQGKIALADDALAATSTIIADTLKSENDPKILSDRIMVERNRIFEVAMQTGDPAFVKSTREDFNKKVLNAIVDYTLSPTFADTPSQAIKLIESGNFGKLTELMKTVDRDKLKKAYIERAGEEATMWDRASKLNASKNVDELNTIEDDLYAGKISGSEAYRRTKALGITLPDEKRKAWLNGDLAGANPQNYGNFESLADRGKLGEADIDGLAKNGQISWKQANTLKKIARGNEKDMGAARQFIDNTLGINDPLSPGLEDSKAKASRAKATLAQKKQEALTAGLPFNAMEAAQTLVKEKEISDSVSAKETARKGLENISKENGLEYKENWTDEDLRRAGIKSEDVRKKIMRQVRAIQK
jgi:hypothetical protein